VGALHPEFKLPLWAAVAIPAAAYLYRSVARGFDFRPDMPVDALVLGMFAALLGVVYLGRRARAQHEREEHDAAEQRDEDEEA
jgi:predicted nucleotidyltransferase